MHVAAFILCSTNFQFHQDRILKLSPIDEGCTGLQLCLADSLRLKNYYYRTLHLFCRIMNTHDCEQQQHGPPPFPNLRPLERNKVLKRWNCIVPRNSELGHDFAKGPCKQRLQRLIIRQPSYQSIKFAMPERMIWKLNPQAPFLHQTATWQGVVPTLLQKL